MQEGYFKTAWSDIKNSPGWFGKCCLLGLLLFIPVFGPIVMYGYLFGWARDIAWDVHRPLPERIFGNEDGQLYSRGFHVWLIMLIVSVITSVLASIAADNDFASIVVMAVGIFLSVIAGVCIMRAVIYARLGAGFQLNRVWSMASHDASGLLRILGMVLLVGLIVGILWIILFSIVLAILIACGIGLGVGVDWIGLSDALAYGAPDAESQLIAVLGMLAPVIGIAIVLFLVLFYLINVAQAWMMMLQSRALGYWTRQFDVARWGGQDDPMPFELENAVRMQAQTAQYAAAQQHYQQQAQQYQQVGQVPNQVQVGQAPVQQQPGMNNPYAASGYPQAQPGPYAQQGQAAPGAPTQPAPQGGYPQPVPQGGYPKPERLAQPAQQTQAASVAAQPAQAYQPAGSPQFGNASQQAAPAQSAQAAQPVSAQGIQGIPVAQAAQAPQSQPAQPSWQLQQEQPPQPAQQAAQPAQSAKAPAYVGRPVQATPVADVPLAPRWEKIDLKDDDAQSGQLPAYAGRRVEKNSEAADIPLAPRWDKIDTDSL